MDPFIHYGMAAGIQAIEDSGIEITEANRDRIGAAIGSGIGGLPGIEKSYGAYMEGGPRKISPFFVPSNIINMVSGNLSIRYGFNGPNYAIVTACSTGAHCIGDAARLIERGDVDVMVAGGTEQATCVLGIGGFGSARALSTRNDEPERASRPWDADRDGFVLSDGAGVMVLEEFEHAKARGATIYAELAGFGWNGDAYHMTAPSEKWRRGGEMYGAGIEGCLDRSPSRSVTSTPMGTSTPAGDKAETLAVKRTFADHATKLAVSSTKSMVGHALGAAGGLEAIFTVLAVRDQIAPPTINYETPDPDCDLDCVPNTAREMPIEYALSNSFGFGGTNGTLCFKRFAG